MQACLERLVERDAPSAAELVRGGLVGLCAETLEAEDDEREVTEALDENQAAAGAAGAAVAGTSEEVRNSRTDGGLWNVRRRVTVF